LYVAQAIPQIDTEIAQKGHLNRPGIDGDSKV
jgi:hypothetical protein